MNVQDWKGQTALMAAARKGRFAIVDELIKAGAGADANAHTDCGSAAFSFAARNGHYAVASILKAAGAH